MNPKHPERMLDSVLRETDGTRLTQSKELDMSTCWNAGNVLFDPKRDENGPPTAAMPDGSVARGYEPTDPATAPC